MNRQAQAAMMFLVGAALLHAGATDLYLRYVKAGLRPLLLAAGAVLIVSALATAWYEWRRSRRRTASASAATGHSHPEPRISWLLVLPLLLLPLPLPDPWPWRRATCAGSSLGPG